LEKHSDNTHAIPVLYGWNHILHINTKHALFWHIRRIKAYLKTYTYKAKTLLLLDKIPNVIYAT
jgi:hypothetical protein